MKDCHPDDLTKCDPTCGAVYYAEHDKLSRCVIGTQFKKWNNDDWQLTSDSLYLAREFTPIRKSNFSIKYNKQ